MAIVVAGQKKRNLNKEIYYLAKKLIFRFDSEKMHNLFVSVGATLGSSRVARKSVSAIFDFEHPALTQKILGTEFRNPIGLAAGFDYDAKLTEILPEIGFGFESVGSLTLKSYAGNAPPRLARLVKSKSLLVNKGLKNSGVKEVVSKLKKKEAKFPLGISVAKSNCMENSVDEAAIADYISSFQLLKKSGVGDFYELNISCPNAFGGEAFTSPKRLDSLLSEMDELQLKKPILLKMPVDFSEQETDALCKVAAKHNVHGLIFGNLTKARDNPSFDRDEISLASKGNFSGIPTQKKSDALINFAYKKYKSKFVIVGCGGVFSAEDAYRKIKLGASLVQLITGMIYEGPSLISEINRELVELLKKDGFANISEAIGKDNSFGGFNGR